MQLMLPVSHTAVVLADRTRARMAAHRSGFVFLRAGAVALQVVAGSMFLGTALCVAAVWSGGPGDVLGSPRAAVVFGIAFFGCGSALATAVVAQVLKAQALTARNTDRIADELKRLADVLGDGDAPLVVTRRSADAA